MTTSDRGATDARIADPRRIVFVNRYFWPDESATSQMLTDLARGLAAGGRSVHIITSRQLIDDPGASLTSREFVAGIAVHRVWSSTFGRGNLAGRALDYASFYIASGWRLLRLLRRGDVAVAMTDPPLYSIVAWAATAMCGGTLVNWLQDLFPEVASQLHANPLPASLNALLRRVRNATLRAARVNVALGGRMRAYLLALPLATNRVCVIENWADERAIAPRLPTTSQLRAALDPTADFVVGYSGNFGRAHDFSTLVEAADLLREDRGIVFLMIGAGAKLAALRLTILERGLESFRFLPLQPRADLADALAAADVHLVTLQPELEGLIVPSKFYGILAAGRPTLFVGDADGEIARAIAEHDCGIAVPMGRGELLAAAIRSLRTNRSLCAAIGKRSRGAFEARYTASRAIEQWQALLDRVVMD